MIHAFDVDLAVSYGVDEAIFIENVRLWLNSNQAAKRNFHKGKYWTYNTANAYSILFPYWNSMKVHRLTKSLEEKGVLQVDCLSPNTHDRTKWYTFTDEFQFANLQNRSIKNAKSLISTDINTDTVVQDSKTIIRNPDLLFNSFWNIYPRKTNKAFAKKVFQKLNPSNELFVQMTDALEKFPFSKDPQYIPHASTWLNGRRWEDEVVAELSDYDKIMGKR